MGLLVLAILCFAAAAILPKVMPHRVPNEVRGLTSIAFVCFGIFLILSTSFTIIPSDKVGHMNRVYFAKNMKSGQVIALSGQKGPQAEILPPGLQFRIMLNILYDIEKLDMVEVPDGKYGYLIAKDGIPLGKTQYLAPAWNPTEFQNMMDAEYFLTKGGIKGPQLSVLKPGKYRINRYLFDYKLGDATDVEAGFVAVVKSNIQELSDAECATVSDKVLVLKATPTEEIEETEGDVAFAEDTIEETVVVAFSEMGVESVLSAPLVKKGCIGIWDEPLPPNRYYLNQIAYNVTFVDTRVQTWNYKGGYQRRYIDLKVGEDGRIEQTERTETVPVPDDAAAEAIVTRIQGWQIPQELRMQVQVKPKNAPRLVAAVGNIEEAENKIITPATRSTLRNVTAASDVMHLIDENRTVLEDNIEKAVKPEGMKAGVSVLDVRLVDSAIPPELLVATCREQLADQLKETYKKEKIAQYERIATEKARAEANQQDELMKSEIAKKIAKNLKEQQRLNGEGEKLRLLELTKGERARVAVLGEEKVYQLAVLKEVLAAAIQNPEIVKIPRISVTGDTGGGWSGPAAILGDSTLTRGILGSSDIIQKQARED